MQMEPHIMQHLCGLATDLANAKHGERKQLINRAAGLLGRSEQWVYSQLKKIDPTTSRKQRSDRGASKLNREECQLISNLMVQAVRDSGKSLLSLKEAVNIAQANGLIRKNVSETTVAREMRRHRLHPEQVKQGSPFTQLRSLHPNHVWQFDVSVCVLYYLKSNEGLQVMPKDEFYKNKPENLERIKNDRVLRYLVTDHYTGAFYVEYFNTPGENAETLTEFLLKAFGKRDNDPFHGVPFMLIWDAGTANQSNLVKGMLSRLEVQAHTHEVGSPRAKGQVERTHDLVERSFESRLSFCTINSIEQLNVEAQKWSVMFNSTRPHSRHGHTRFGLWQTIKQSQLRIRPALEFCLSLLEKVQPASRKVKGDLTIEYAIKGFGSHRYSVENIPNIGIGESIMITYNPYKVPNITAIYEGLDGEHVHYELAPIELDEAGFNIGAPIIGQSYRSLADTPSDKARKAMNLDAYGVEKEIEVKAARKTRKPAFEGRIDAFADVKQAAVPDFMARKGHDLKVRAPIRSSELKISYAKAVPMIRDSIGLNKDSDQAKRLTRIFKQRYPDGISEEEVYEFTKEMNTLFGVTTDKFKRVENGE
jgi:transposase InsO family protein